MPGCYLYAIRRHGGARIARRGIDGVSGVRAIPFQDLDAIVSSVDLRTFGSRMIAQRAREDLGWITMHARRHEVVIERAMGLPSSTTAVVPMKFGTIFTSYANLARTVQEHRQRFRQLLDRFDGRTEWGVKVYEDERKLRSEISPPTVLPMPGRSALRMSGTAYLQTLEAEAVITRSVAADIARRRERWFRALADIAEQAVQSPLRASEFTGTRNPMVLNGAFLVPNAAVRRFTERVGALRTANPAFTFTCTGPWPPYHFVEEDADLHADL